MPAQMLHLRVMPIASTSWCAWCELVTTVPGAQSCERELSRETQGIGSQSRFGCGTETGARRICMQCVQLQASQQRRTCTSCCCCPRACTACNRSRTARRLLDIAANVEFHRSIVRARSGRCADRLIVPVARATIVAARAIDRWKAIVARSEQRKLPQSP